MVCGGAGIVVSGMWWCWYSGGAGIVVSSGYIACSALNIAQITVTVCVSSGHALSWDDIIYDGEPEEKKFSAFFIK